MMELEPLIFHLNFEPDLAELYTMSLYSSLAPLSHVSHCSQDDKRNEWLVLKLLPEASFDIAYIE